MESPFQKKLYVHNPDSELYLILFFYFIWNPNFDVEIGPWNVNFFRIVKHLGEINT